MSAPASGRMVPVGRWVDRRGARGVMTAGSAAAALLLLAWAAVDRLWVFYAVWAGLGVASAAVLYEPAFAVVASWFERLRARALTLLTLIGGLASVVFVPLATALVAVRSPSFRWLALAFGLSALTTSGAVVHLVPLLLERGFTPALAGVVTGAVGLAALPGRAALTPLGSRWPRPAVTASIFVLQGVGFAALIAAASPVAAWAFVALFGAGFGAVTSARAALLAELYGPAAYGSIGGVLALVLAAARAAGPLGASILHAAGGYDAVLVALLLTCVAAAAAVLRAGVSTSPLSTSAGAPA